MKTRNLIIVLGDQLSLTAGAFEGCTPEQDVVFMAESAGEIRQVWSSKQRIVLFLSAMRHFRQRLEDKGWSVQYQALEDEPTVASGQILDYLGRVVETLQPQALRVLQPGNWRILASLQDAAQGWNLPLDVMPDQHFYLDSEQFSAWLCDKEKPLLEHFYRHMRQQSDVLMEGDEPAGGQWNYDQENRDSFGQGGPPDYKARRRFRPDQTTRQVMQQVEQAFGDHPGGLESFQWPVTRPQALALLREFVAERLPQFGSYQDAIWKDTTFLFHSALSAALNLHLLSARECVEAAVDAFEQNGAPINSVEGFVRQILGWREFVRGIYWHFMPEYSQRNTLGAKADLPGFYWDGDTDMACLADAMNSVRHSGYAHHIQRLMVLGLFAQLLGVQPEQFNRWHLAMYVDAVDWVSLPNTLGMSQFADGGIMGSKPYCASGNYINKMSNCCQSCRYDYRQATGEEACPFTTLYWDFLARHEDRFRGHGRMRYQYLNLDKKDNLPDIRRQAHGLKTRLGRATGCDWKLHQF